MTKRRSRGDGSIYHVPSKGLWCANFKVGCDANGTLKRRYVYGKTKADVQKKLHELRSAAESGSLVCPKKIRVAEYLQRWLEDVARPTIRSSTHFRYDSLIRTHIVPHIGGVQLSSLEPGQVQNLYKKLEDTGASPRTREFVHVILKKAMDQAMRGGYVARNVCSLVKKPRVPKKAMKCWNIDQTNHFLETAKIERLYALYVTAFSTGLRQGELFGLQWSDIDFNTHSLSVLRTVTELNGKISIGEPKTAKGRRKVELPEGLIKTFKEHRKNMLSEGNHATWVFCDTNGGPLRKSNFRNHSLLPLIKKSGLPVIRFHDFRHTAATLLLAEGVHPKVVQERLGHAQISITLDTYSHVLPSMQKEAAAKLNAIFKL